MRTTSIRIALALTAFFFVVEWSRPARADVTISGTVGEIGIANGNFGAYVRFKLTTVNATATCLDPGQGFQGAGYAWFYDSPQNSPAYKEWYAALLYSKKGSPVSVTVLSATNCLVTSVTLP